MKHECEDDNTDEGDIIKFDSLEDALGLLHKHDMEGCYNQLKPVLLLEPGDLILEVLWAGVHDGVVLKADYLDL